MPNEYGKILLQQIEQQRQQRERQRAEERGLPILPKERQRPVATKPEAEVPVMPDSSSGSDLYAGFCDNFSTLPGKHRAREVLLFFDKSVDFRGNAPSVSQLQK